MSRLCNAQQSMLIIVDLQERLMPVIHEGEAVLRNAMRLGKAAKLLEIPVIGTAQYPEGLGPNVAEVHALCDTVIAKNDFDACAEKSFMSALTSAKRDDLIVFGCEAHVCVLQTVLGLLRRNQRVRLVADAIGARQPLNKAIAMERAKAAGAELITTEMVLFEWIRTNEHPRFKEILQLIKTGE